jgi:hypothetical protein
MTPTTAASFLNVALLLPARNNDNINDDVRVVQLIKLKGHETHHRRQLLETWPCCCLPAQHNRHGGDGV